MTIPYHNEETESFWGLDLRGEYRYNLGKQFFVLPAVGLQYERHQESLYISSASITETTGSYCSHGSAWGMSLYPQVGLNVASQNNTSVDLFTGPAIRYYFEKNDSFSDDTHNNQIDGEHWKVMWNFGIGFNFSRFSVRGEYAIKVSKTDWSHNTAALRVAYHF